MKNSVLLLVYFISISTIYGQADFGYISYSTANIGDDIQAIAAKRFLPENSIAIDRELIGDFYHQEKVKTIMNGWYMHTKKYCWYRNDILAPENSWPPSPAIDPLLISMHLTDGFLPEALSDEGIEYFKQHGPVGARDYHTLHELQKRNIPSYFSGCMTLTLQNNCKERDPIIYVVDLDDESVEYIRSKTKHQVKILHHGLMLFTYLTNEQRLKYAEQLLEKYKRATCVITSRLHVSMPCLALETPVLLIKEKNNPRFSGLIELVRSCTLKEFLQGQYDFDFDHPPENPKDYLPLRENLIKTVTDWVHQAQDNI